MVHGRVAPCSEEDFHGHGQVRTFFFLSDALLCGFVVETIISHSAYGSCCTFLSCYCRMTRNFDGDRMMREVGTRQLPDRGVPTSPTKVTEFACDT